MYNEYNNIYYDPNERTVKVISKSSGEVLGLFCEKSSKISCVTYGNVERVSIFLFNHNMKIEHVEHMAPGAEKQSFISELRHCLVTGEPFYVR